MTSHEECMREAAECDRLVGLAATLLYPKHDEGGCLPLAQAGREGSGASDDGNDTQWRVDTVAILAAAG